MTLTRYSDSQNGRSLVHPLLPQPSPNCSDEKSESVKHSPSHCFVVCADTQIGMTSGNKEWETELAYSREAIKMINNLNPRPLFCCMCGDLVDMQFTFFEGKGFTKEECDQIQDQQNSDFKSVWSDLHEDIAMVCLCGNHDLGNLPTRKSIEKFTNAFGDDYLAFWANGTYNIVLNTTLFSKPSGAEDMYKDQLHWLEERLKYARAKEAGNIFVFGHHPWFLYNEEEKEEDMKALSPYPVEWGPREGGFPDSYFVIPEHYRKPVMDLFEEYKVSAAFSGHFHQNLVSKASFGMDMIITSSLSMVFESTGKPKDHSELNTRGFRVVKVADGGNFSHRFIDLQGES